jgi:hypothetical protein
MKFRHRRDRQGRAHFHHQREPDQAGDRRDVVQEVEGKPLVERWADGACGSDQQQGVSVGGRAHDRLHADIGAGARLVLDHDGLTEALQPPGHVPDDVRRAPRRQRHDEADRPRRVSLCGWNFSNDTECAAIPARRSN